MIRNVIIGILFVLVYNMQAQTPTWSNVSCLNFNFKLPSNNYYRYDTLGLHYYSYSDDSSRLKYDIVYFDNADVSGNHELVALQEEMNTNDLFEIITKLIWMQHGGELKEFVREQYTNSSYGGTLCFKVPINEEIEDQEYVYIFYKIIFWDRHFTMMSISSSFNFLEQLYACKNKFFNEINFY